MSPQRKIPIYLKIVNDLQEKIAKGFYPEDTRLPSRSELCKKYSISEMTAVRVHNELEKMGIAYKLNGKGVFASSLKSHPINDIPSSLPKPRNIVIYRWAQTQSRVEQWFLDMIIGVQQRSLENGLNLRNELFSPENQGSYNMSDEDGLIVPYDSGCEWMLPMLKRRRMRCVMLNNYFPEAHCVVTDNYHGIALLLDHLQDCGARKIFLCTGHFVELGIANLSERTYAFENECRRRKLEHRVLTNGNYQELTKLIKSEKPDALMFTDDNTASEFKDSLRTLKLSKEPIVTGFDGFDMKKSTQVKDLTTIKVDYIEMGRKAVDLILNNSFDDWNMPNITRVRGELIVGD